MTDETASSAPDRDAAHALTYDGTAIRRRGTMLNLTDMWRAAGGDDSRRPADWLAQEDAKRFRAYTRWRWPDSAAPAADPHGRGGPNASHAGIWRFDADGLVAAARGNGGGTWAHWQLALAYAKYLSPAFHAWCNQVVRDAMERSGGPPRGRDPVVLYVERQFERVHRKLDALDRHAADLMFLAVSAQDILLDARRPFSGRSRAAITAVVTNPPYEGHCPSCGVVPVLTPEGRPAEGAEFDHFFHRGLNRPEHGWLVCQPCHRELTHGGYLARFARVAEFRRFQAAVVDARRDGTGAGEPPPDRPARR